MSKRGEGQDTEDTSQLHCVGLGGQFLRLWSPLPPWLVMSRLTLAEGLQPDLWFDLWELLGLMNVVLTDFPERGASPETL